MQKKVLPFKLEMVSNKYTTEQRLFSLCHKSQSQTELDRLKSPVDFQLMSFCSTMGRAIYLVLNMIKIFPQVALQAMVFQKKFNHIQHRRTKISSTIT